MDFETGALFNYVNGRNASTFNTTPDTQNISVVSSPVKFGTKSLKIKADDGDDGLYWDATVNPSTSFTDTENIDGLDKSVVVVLIGALIGQLNFMLISIMVPR